MHYEIVNCNSIVIDHAAWTAIDCVQNFDLMHPMVRPPAPPPKKKLCDIFRDLQDDRIVLVAELKMVGAEQKALQSHLYEPVKEFDSIAAVHVCLETLAAQDQLDCMSNSVKTEYSKVFNSILHVDVLPSNVYCHIKLKDASKTITTCTYSSNVDILL